MNYQEITKKDIQKLCLVEVYENEQHDDINKLSIEEQDYDDTK